MHARIFDNMLADLRGTSTYMKSKIKKAQKSAGDKGSGFADAFRDAVRSIHAAVAEAASGEALMQRPEVRAVPVLPGLPLGVVDDSLTPADRGALRKYVLILYALSQTDDHEAVLTAYKAMQTQVQAQNEHDLDEAGFTPALAKAMRLLSACFGEQQHQAAAEEEQVDARHQLCGTSERSSPEQSQRLCETLLRDSKIGQLAKEISSEVDFSKLNLSKPEDLLNVNNLLGGDGPLSSMIGQVSSKIQQKLQTGELRHEELLSEAMGLLKTFDSSGALGGLLNPDLLRPLMSGLHMKP